MSSPWSGRSSGASPFQWWRARASASQEGRTLNRLFTNLSIIMFWIVMGCGMGDCDCGSIPQAFLVDNRSSCSLVLIHNICCPIHFQLFPSTFNDYYSSSLLGHLVPRELPVVVVNVRIELGVLPAFVVATVIAQPNVVSLQIVIIKLINIRMVPRTNFTQEEYFTNSTYPFSQHEREGASTWAWEKPGRRRLGKCFTCL